MTEEERIYNYPLSRARRIIENAFGILANCFRCLLSTLQLSPEKLKHLVFATVVLHNIMRAQYPGLQNGLLDREVHDHCLILGLWRIDAVMQEMVEVRAPTGET